MRIKKEYLNEKSLSPYGFTERTLSISKSVYCYRKECEYCNFDIDSGSGEIVISPEYDCDTIDLDDVIYRLITDGLVEIDTKASVMYREVFEELRGFARENGIALIGNFDEKTRMYSYRFWDRLRQLGYRRLFSKEELERCTSSPAMLAQEIIEEMRDEVPAWFEEERGV